MRPSHDTREETIASCDGGYLAGRLGTDTLRRAGSTRRCTSASRDAAARPDRRPAGAAADRVLARLRAVCDAARSAARARLGADDW